MNYFFALEVPLEVRDYVRQVAALWKRTAKVSSPWYAPEDYHITLKFLGNVPEDKVANLISLGTSSVGEFSQFTVTLAPPGVFSSNGSKRILWMGVRRNTEIVSLAAALDQTCGIFGYSREHRQYAPHITVARIGKGGEKASADNVPKADERLFPSWQAERFVLMQTLPPEKRANGSKARYNIVHTFPFGISEISDVS